MTDDLQLLELAQGALAKLIAAGVAPARVTQEVGSIVAGWAEEPEMSPAIAQAWIEFLWDGFSKDAADLQERIADTEGRPEALRLARRTLTAMDAAVQALAAAHAAMT